jgi:hypothetical protein
VQAGGDVTEYIAGRDYAIAPGWLETDRSGTWIILLQELARTCELPKPAKRDAPDPANLWNFKWNKTLACAMYLLASGG